MFHLIWVLGAQGGGGAPKGLANNLLMQVFTLESSKIEVSETYFFDIVITYNYHPRYAKCVFGRIYVVFHLFGVLGAGGGGSNGVGTQPAYAIFQPMQLKIEVLKVFFF